MPTPRSRLRARSRQPRRRQPWWYDVSSQPARFALLLCGRVGPLRLSPSKALFAKRPALPSRALIQLASAAHHTQIIHPNLASGGCDVFIHTWNPEEAELIDGLYSVVALAPLCTQPWVDPGIASRSRPCPVGFRWFRLEHFAARTRARHHKPRLARTNRVFKGGGGLYKCELENP